MQLHSLPYTYIVRHLRNTSTFMYCGTLLYISHETSFSFVCCGMSTCLLQCRFTSVYVSIIRACTKGQFRTNSFISECQLLVLFIRLSLFFARREHTIYLLVYILYTGYCRYTFYVLFVHQLWILSNLAVRFLY